MPTLYTILFNFTHTYSTCQTVTKTNLTTTLHKTILYALYTTLHNFKQLYKTSQDFTPLTSTQLHNTLHNKKQTLQQRFYNDTRLYNNFFTNVYTTIHTFRTTLQDCTQLYNNFTNFSYFHTTLQIATKLYNKFLQTKIQDFYKTLNKSTH